MVVKFRSTTPRVAPEGTGDAPLVTDRIYEVLRRLAERGTAAVIVEQYVQRVLDIADTVYILSRGQIVHFGGASEITADQICSKYLGIE